MANGCDAVTLADSGRTDQQHVAALGDKARRSEFAQAHARQFGIEAPVEITEVLDLGDTGLLEAAQEEAVGAYGELIAHEQLEKLEMRELAALGLGQAGRQGLHHPGKTDLLQLAGELRMH